MGQEFLFLLQLHFSPRKVSSRQNVALGRYIKDLCMRKGSEKEGKSFFVFLRRSRLMKGLVLMIVLVLVLVLAKKPRQKVVTLQPLLAREIEDSVAEPSGATFCASTSSLFLICDRTSVCGGVFEMDMEGSLLRNWLFPRKHKDVEAVACDDFNKRLYIAEEGHMRVTSFVLDRKSVV